MATKAKPPVTRSRKAQGTAKKRIRKIFGDIHEVVQMPNLIEVQRESYEQFLRTRFFQPLGMRETRYNSDALKGGDNVATGHAMADFTTLQPAPRMTWRNVAGAGGLYSSVTDMAKWMNAQLAGGTYRDARGREQALFTPARQKAMWSLVTPIPIAEPKVEALKAAKPNFLGYGEGWMVSDFQGRKLVWHTGGWPGMVSRLTLVPEHKLGVVVLTSAEVGAAFNAVTMRALDAFLDAPRTDWLAAYAAAVAKAEAKADESWQSTSRRVTRSPSPRCRWRSMPAPTGMPGTATSPSRRRRPSW